MSISGAIASQLPQKKPDLLLSNIMKLEDLLRHTSKEENPVPNYRQLMRTENKAEEFERERKEKELKKPFEDIQNEIISNSVE